MAVSHTGRLGSQSDQFSGSQETSASLSLSLSVSLPLSLQPFVWSMWTGEQKWRAVARPAAL